MWAKPLYICKKGVAAPAPKASLKWLGRTPGGGLVFCDTPPKLRGAFIATLAWIAIKKASYKVKGIYIYIKTNFSFKAIINADPNSFNLNTKT